ncbi:MAG: PAS domain-containing protein [Chloroflexi bacterium]|nr:PAS domain-containing protein [Chloroflexota bacterium]
MPDFIYVKDRQRRMLLNNVAHARSLGARGDVDPLGKTDDDLFPADMAAGFYADEEQLFLAGQSIKNREERTIGEDGGEIWALTTKVPLQNLRGEVIGLVGITKDITAIKVGAEALRASEERYRATIAAMSEGVVVQGTDGAIQLCNEAAVRILGLTVDQMVGLTSVDPRWRAIHEDGSPFPGETHPAMVALRTGESQSDVVMGVHKPDGALTWILVNASAAVSPGRFAALRGGRHLCRHHDAQKGGRNAEAGAGAGEGAGRAEVSLRDPGVARISHPAGGDPGDDRDSHQLLGSPGQAEDRRPAGPHSRAGRAYDQHHGRCA